MAQRYGVVALGRPTFDVPFAKSMTDDAFAALDAAGIDLVGRRELCFNTESAEAALKEALSGGNIKLMLILQVTFTDALMAVQIADAAKAAGDIPVAIWAVPEPRLGGRLRLNAFCGLNLAAHALKKAGHTYGWLYAKPDAPQIAEDLQAIAETVISSETSAATPAPVESEAADKVLAALDGATISVLGKHPDGFDTCEYDPDQLKSLVGLNIETLPLEPVFDKARAADAAEVAGYRAEAESYLDGLDEVDQDQLDRSFRVLSALKSIQQDHGARGLAVRCWPEMFTEYGCSACGPMAMMNEAGVPSGCEADVFGSLSAIVMQELAGEPSWMADLVDVDAGDDTAVFWHCGLAPISMRDPDEQATATIHTNRKMPLLHQFPLKPGRVTLTRISQSAGEIKMMIASGEMLKLPMAFTGTSGTLRFDRPVDQVTTTIMEEGLEHHYALAYGDYRDSLKALAAKLDIPVVELT